MAGRGGRTCTCTGMTTTTRLLLVIVVLAVFILTACSSHCNTPFCIEGLVR